MGTDVALKKPMMVGNKTLGRFMMDWAAVFALVFQELVAARWHGS